ncbi:hypothetical protein HME9302_01965 [Alteripontixanthobacter maritimus]|uniref:Sulfatase N-terminal domain-containing protein n=1 Tax=Alteripontixanthobacter maritimus TaxID=2161824 RepID=A0A369QCV7_9SPHN|nr:sulfatase-like hydrolase/transferase [Alteripontixanthobacter maritimus]RDC60749.1 hypothetical protein HME9302_01965 [Alteripontixanthobacter maritimus]
MLKIGAPERTMPKFELLRALPLRWTLIWLILPNLVIIAMWPIGGPSMAAPLFLGGLYAIAVSQLPSARLRRLGIAVLFALVLGKYVTKSFNVDDLNILHMTAYFGQLQVFKAPEYLLAAAVLGVALLVALKYEARAERFTSMQQLLMAGATVALLVMADTYATAGVRGTYKASAPEGFPVDSAMLQNTIAPDTVAAKNLVVIIVESWGVPNNPVDKTIDDAIWNPAQWSAKYEVDSGISTYFGSTTNAELRELCGVWADHLSFDFGSANCLPGQFREAGFQTTAMHSFNPDFFGRDEWYPQLGFDTIRFDQALQDRGARFCDGVFAGACDHDVPRQIGDTLRERSGSRNFIYWLTLNAHLPISANREMGTDTCDLGLPAWRKDYPILCRSYTAQRTLANSITAEIMRDDFPQSDILIVGDHMPPFFPRALRTRFDTTSVPWIHLTARRDGKGSAPASLASAR